MYKEARRTTFPSRCLLSGSWYVFQQRDYYQAFLNQEFSLLDIKFLMIVAN